MVKLAYAEDYYNEHCMNDKRLSLWLQLKNETFDMPNMQFGPNEDKTIASSSYGVAVYVDGNWQVYNCKKKGIMYIKDEEIDLFPTCIIPSKVVNIGSVIKDAGRVYFVEECKKDYVKAIDATTWKRKYIEPIINIMLKETCYSKIVSLTDLINLK